MSSTNNSNQNKINAAVLVLGDLNRSPRMLNHAKAISELIPNVNQVSLIGYDGGDIRGDIKNDKKIIPYYIGSPCLNKFLCKLPRFCFIFVALIKIIVQLFSLTYTLIRIPKPKFLILQNPPGIPAILICLIVCLFRRCTFVLDWHNYGYTILKVNRRNRIICFIAYVYEYILGRFASISLCVSQSMQRNLNDKFGVKAIELPDRAMSGVFHCGQLNHKEIFGLFTKYKETFTVDDFLKPVPGSKTNELTWKENRPMILLSSTSWTPDEDFNMLLEAMINIDSDKDLLEVDKKLGRTAMAHLIITGRGPMRDEFIAKVESAKLKHFKVKTIWLESNDYPKILSAVDMGICLHYSSSGFDLPMKVVDMFSAGLPVCAVEYPTIHELVKDKTNGFLFKDQTQLSEQLKRKIIEFGEKGSSNELDLMRKNIQKEFTNTDWVSQWKERLLPKLKLKIKEL